ncbi:MAG: VWA domain-containing protein [Anaerolineaceae bacterium]|nr:VWA domain-containing protein [Anaerolineaceae bacterium]
MKTFFALFIVFSQISSQLFTAPHLPLAQENGEPELVIQSVIADENSDDLTLNIYFNILNSFSRKPLSDIEIAQISLTMDDSSPVNDIFIREPDTPMYIVLVLDSSGSMAGSGDVLQNAAINAIRNSPQDTHFAVIQFHENIQVISNFEDTRAASQNAIQKIMPQAGKGTCLYDAAYQAIDLLQKAPAGRRSVVLFTDGKDELADGSACSQHDLEDVLNFATRENVNVPINTIGLGNKDINAEELITISSLTGASYAIGQIGELENIFSEIMDSLQAQRLAKVFLHPPPGKHSAEFSVTLADESVLSKNISFEVSHDYSQEVTPPGVQVSDLNYDESTQTLQMMLSIDHPERLNLLQFSLWQENGIKLDTVEYQFGQDLMPYDIPAEQLNEGESYQITLTAYDEKNQPILDTEGNYLLIQHDFIFTSGDNPIKLDILSAEYLETLNLKLEISDPDQRIQSFEGWLYDEKNFYQQPGSEFAFQKTAPDNSVQIDLEPFDEGQYSVVVLALDTNGQSLGRAEHILLFPEEETGFLANLFSGKTKSLLIILLAGGIFIVFVIILIAIAFARKRPPAYMDTLDKKSPQTISMQSHASQAPQRPAARYSKDDPDATMLEMQSVKYSEEHKTRIDPIQEDRPEDRTILDMDLKDLLNDEDN